MFKGDFNPAHSDLVFGEGGLLNPKKLKPILPKKPDLLTPEQAAKAAALAADKKKKEAIAAYGTSDTILTGPKGLGSTGGGKKLLGE